jgi:hypothetical protein
MLLVLAAVALGLIVVGFGIAWEMKNILKVEPIK